MGDPNSNLYCVANRLRLSEASTLLEDCQLWINWFHREISWAQPSPAQLQALKMHLFVTANTSFIESKYHWRNLSEHLVGRAITPVLTGTKPGTSLRGYSDSMNYWHHLICPSYWRVCTPGLGSKSRIMDKKQMRNLRFVNPGRALPSS